MASHAQRTRRPLGGWQRPGQSSGRGELLASSIRLGRVAGIPVGLHYSWFIIAGLITLSLAAQFRETQPVWDTGLVWTVSIVTALLFFVSLVAHELSHGLVARAYGIPVRSITLFALGGVANIDRGASTAVSEFFVAIVGPVTSVVIGAVSIAVALAMGWSATGGPSTAVASVLGWLGSINLLLAAFNLIPGYPLDGGRVLRAILWGAYKDEDRATQHAARVGQLVAGLFIAIGVLQFFGGAGLGGLWLAFIGWFLLLAAQAAHAQVSITQTLSHVRVGDIMGQECPTIEAGSDLRTVVDDLLLRTGRRCAVVQRGGHVLGLVTANEVRTIERARWTEVTAGDVMRPLEALETVSPDTTAADALAKMTRQNVNQLPVVVRGHFEGIVSRGHILQLLQSRADLGM